MSFPDGFWWGTGASSTQCEGAAPASDWRAWESDGHAPPSGDGNGFATHYGDDFALFAGHGLTHHRLSIEWARIEPENGRRDPAAIDHYREMLRAAGDAGIAPWVCLHHFSLPGWFSVDEHGFVDARSRSYYWPRHVDFIAETFGDQVFGWQPVNEPSAYALLGWLLGAFPPGHRDRGRFSEALEAIHLATFDAARRLRSLGKPVASIHNLAPIRTLADTAEASEVARRLDASIWGCWIGGFQNSELEVPGRGPVEVPGYGDAFDLVGFSYYSAYGVAADGSIVPYPTGARVGPLGYAPWSEGLGEVLHRLAESLPDQPLLVAEHGVGTDDDSWRESVLRDSLGEVEQAIDDGIDVRGFFHWTGVDNYEWHYGFDVPFGLFDRDRNSKPSAALAASWARAGGAVG
jgi:beta-glucosidase